MLMNFNGKLNFIYFLLLVSEKIVLIFNKYLYHVYIKLLSKIIMTCNEVKCVLRGDQGGYFYGQHILVVVLFFFFFLLITDQKLLKYLKLK